MCRIYRTSILLLIGGVTALLAADELSNDDRRNYVDFHNTYRSGADPQAADMKMMELDIELENLAKEWASRCVFKHGNPPNEIEGPIGQNIFMSTNRADIVADAIKGFYSEFEYYTMDSNTCQPGKVCGHYTQLMWAKSYKVGCGVSTKCPNNKYIFVCNYASAGNFVGEKPYVIGTSCSSCEVGWSGCYENLCTRNGTKVEKKAVATVDKSIHQPAPVSLPPTVTEQENTTQHLVTEDKSVPPLETEGERKIDFFFKFYKSLLPNRFSQVVEYFLNYFRSKNAIE